MCKIAEAFTNPLYLKVKISKLIDVIVRDVYVIFLACLHICYYRNVVYINIISAVAVRNNKILAPTFYVIIRACKNYSITMLTPLFSIDKYPSYYHTITK